MSSIAARPGTSTIATRPAVSAGVRVGGSPAAEIGGLGNNAEVDGIWPLQPNCFHLYANNEITGCWTGISQICSMSYDYPGGTFFCFPELVRRCGEIGEHVGFQG